MLIEILPWQRKSLKKLVSIELTTMLIEILPWQRKSLKKLEEKNTIEDHNVEIQLPPGTELTNLAGIDLPSGDIGHALQLLEFCETFGEVFELKKGDPEILLHKLTCANANKGHEPLVVPYQIAFFNRRRFGKKYSGKSWVEDFKECTCEFQYSSEENLLEFFNLQPNRYDELCFREKLKLLNFLCDEALDTVKLRLWIDERNVEESKKAKEKLIAKRHRGKKKHEEEGTRRGGKSYPFTEWNPLYISEQKDLVSIIDAETLANSSEMRCRSIHM